MEVEIDTGTGTEIETRIAMDIETNINTAIGNGDWCGDLDGD